MFPTHQPSLERRDDSIRIVERFPERDEDVITPSEFQRVKAHLLRLTNAKAGVSVDFDDVDDSKPTLKKRMPDADTSDDVRPGTSSSDEPPKLKKRSEPTTPPPGQ